ncbi:MAG TPA: hypothetical protein VIW92_11915, partial [Thermoanaerobaculia bacterium]
MSRNSVRTVLFVLGVLCVLSVAPLQAKPAQVAGKGTASASFDAPAFLSGLWERAARLLDGVGEKNGVLIDPDGATVPTSPPGEAEEGTPIDPDGRP